MTTIASPTHRKPAGCYHGGAFFEAIGTDFNHLDCRRHIINADVLDAWFPPSPRVLSALQGDLPWLLRTSPPADCSGMVRAIARARGVPCQAILPGAGSSNLIFLALRHWLDRSSRVLLLDPTYGEYAHVLENVIGCRVERLVLSREANYRVPLDELAGKLKGGFDAVILVNPNSPTGQHLSRTELEPLLRRAPAQTLVWVDETYVEYVGAGESLETLVVRAPNVVVCKSMSKVYALSGARAAYLCAAPDRIAELRAITPPWAVSLPAQIAAVKALQDPGHYAECYERTHRLRAQLLDELSKLSGWDVVPGRANFLLCHLPTNGPTAAELVARCREHGLFLRDIGSMGSQLGGRALRIAVKDAETNLKMLAILGKVLRLGG